MTELHGDNENINCYTINPGNGNPQPVEKKSGITYGIDDIPPWYLCIFMALQVSTSSTLHRLLNFLKVEGSTQDIGVT